MQRLIMATRESVDNLTHQLANQVQADHSMIMPFVDFTDTVSALLSDIGDGAERLVVAGHAAPDIEIAADRAAMRVTEVLGTSPFALSSEDILQEINSGREIIYMANPNGITGANFSFRDLELVARAVKNGALILDEKYFDFCRISGLPLVKKHAHVLVIRSLSAGFGIGSDDSGFLVGAAGLLARFKEANRLSRTLHKILSTTLANQTAKGQRLASLREESLRLAVDLTEAGVQSRETVADFLLLRVADPKSVGNYLARLGTPVENLDGYPQLKNYMRYRVQSPLSNDKLVAAFGKMPPQYYRMDDVDRRAIRLHRPDDTEEPEQEGIAERNELGRVGHAVRAR